MMKRYCFIDSCKQKLFYVLSAYEIIKIVNDDVFYDICCLIQKSKLGNFKFK